MGDLEKVVEGGSGEAVGVLVPCRRPLEQARASEGSEGEESDTGWETKVQRGLEGLHRAEAVIELFDVGDVAGRAGAQCLGNFIVDEAGQGDLQRAGAFGGLVPEACMGAGPFARGRESGHEGDAAIS